MEVTITISEEKVEDMLNQVREAKKRGDHSAMVEYGAVTFQVYASDSKKLREFDEKNVPK